MIFMFDLELGALTDELGQTLADDCRAADGWPVSFVPGRVERRWFGIEKSYPPVIEIATENSDGPILAATASRDADAIELRPEALPALTRTIATIGDHFPSGFVFRATWSGSPILHDEHLTISELIRRIRASGLNEFTRYLVEPPGPGR